MCGDVGLNRTFPHPPSHPRRQVFVYVVREMGEGEGGGEGEEGKTRKDEGEGV